MFVGQHEQFQRDSEAEGVGGLAVDSEEKARQLLDRQVGGFCAVDDLVHIERGAPSRPSP